MSIGTTVFLVVFTICATILAGMYIYYCAENEVKMFANPRYDKRIYKLETEVEELRKKL